MNIVMGPVLGFQGNSNSNGDWRLSALFVSKGDADADSLTIQDGGNRQEIDNPTLLKSLADRSVWRYDFTVKQSDSPREVEYMLSGSNQNWSFVVPASGTSPRIAYASCNGFSDPRDMKKTKDQNERWRNMATRHAAEPYHLLLMGGDQVYADTIWEKATSINRWAEKTARKRNDAAFTDIMRQQVERFYFDLYCGRWSQAEPARMYASIPSLMMWDDHDIFDGWGSYDKKQQKSDVFKGIFKAAREHFSVFQQRVKPGEKPAGGIPGQDHFNYLHCVGNIALLALDMRSERSQLQVLSLGSWQAIYTALETITDCKHLLVLSSIPVVHPDFSLLESVFGFLPGQQELEDDLKDHWHSRTHKAERTRLIHRLLDYATENEVRVTLLSGDVHVGAVGVIESRRAGTENGHANVINQLTSSGIVHPAPPALMSFALEFLSKNPEQVDRGIEASLLEFLGTRRRFIMARNWLGLEPDSNDGRIWANWYVEGEEDPYTKVIHPVRG